MESKLYQVSTQKPPKLYTPQKLTKEQIIQKLESDPTKTNTDWGNEWGVSRERVRQFRRDFGLLSRREFNSELFQQALECIENGYGQITTHTFKDMNNFGIKKLNNWIKDNPELQEQVDNAKKNAYQRTHFPKNKKCSKCNVTKPIDSFYNSKSGRDKKMLMCIDCDKNIVKKYYDKRDNDVLVEYKTCAILKELGPLPAHFFHKSRRTSTGLQYTCIAYGKAYSKYRNRYRDIINQPDNPTKDLELRMLGDWKQAAYNEAKNEVQKDLQAEVEARKIFG